MLEYEKVELGFLKTAPIKIELTTRLNVSAEALFEIFEGPDSWGWASIKEVVWETPKPYGAGTTRTIDVEGQGKIQEHFFLWEQGKHMAFRFEKGEMKAVSVLVEDYSVKPISEDECEFTWTIGMKLRGILRLLTPILAGVMRKQFAAMQGKLVEYVDARQVAAN